MSLYYNILMKPVQSTNIKGIGFAESKLILQVQFNNGTVYQFYEVPEIIYNQFNAAQSKGRFFQMHVKDLYKFKKMPADYVPEYIKTGKASDGR